MTTTKPEKPDTLAAALARFQETLPKIAKTKTAKVPTKSGGMYEYSYADLAEVSAVCLPKLGALGLSWSARPTLNAGGNFVLAYRLKHAGGDEEAGEYPLPSPASTTPQALGSAISYARRYTFCAVLGIAAEDDDDGKQATDEHTESWQDARPRPTTPRGGPMMTEKSRNKMFALWKELGYDGEQNQQQRRTIASKLLHRTVESLSELLESEAFVIITALEERKAKQAEPETAEATA